LAPGAGTGDIIATATTLAAMLKDRAEVGKTTLFDTDFLLKGYETVF